jgi:O-ureido-D-serine cyclo-ligase
MNFSSRASIALVSARAARGLDEDQQPLEVALRSIGAQVHVADWDDPEVDWASFDIALLRSTWDYTDRLPEFLAWVERASAQTKLMNPPSVVRWNTDKHYLAELARAAVPTVPSTFVEPGERAAQALDRFLARHDGAELVVKPAVGAGSRDTERHRRTERDVAVAHIQRLLDGSRSVLLQPYLDRVDQDGETALMFFAGRFSHAIRKGPLLPPGGAATSGLFAAEQITPRAPGADEMRVAEQVLAALPFKAPLYARVDLIRDVEGAPRLLELELTEPSLFFVHAAGSADRFASVVLQSYVPASPGAARQP